MQQVQYLSEPRLRMRGFVRLKAVRRAASSICFGQPGASWLPGRPELIKITGRESKRCSNLNNAVLFQSNPLQQIRFPANGVENRILVGGERDKF